MGHCRCRLRNRALIVGHLFVNCVYDLRNGVVFSSVKFHDANPKTIGVVHEAINEALQLINRDHRAVAQIYLEATKENWPLEDIVNMMNDKNFVYSAAPQRSVILADIMYRAGTLK